MCRPTFFTALFFSLFGRMSVLYISLFVLVVVNVNLRLCLAMFFIYVLPELSSIIK